MFCPNCGKQLPENGICPDCNPAVQPEAPATPVAPVAQPEAPAMPVAPAAPATPVAPAAPATPVAPIAPPAAPAAASPVRTTPVPPYQSVASNTYSAPNPTGASIVTAEDPGKQLGTISMILGIVAIALGTICSCLFACLGGFIPLICAIISIVLSVMATKKSKEAGFAKNGPAQIGLILSIVAIAIIVIFIIVNAVLGGVIAASGYSTQFY